MEQGTAAVRRKLKNKIEGRRQSENLSETTSCGQLQNNFAPYQRRAGTFEKMLMRSQRNRESATRSRIRRQEHLHNLEKIVLQKENEQRNILRTISDLTEELNALQSSLNKHKGCCKLQNVLLSLKQKSDNDHPRNGMPAPGCGSQPSHYTTVTAEQMAETDNGVISLKTVNPCLHGPSSLTMDNEDLLKLGEIVNVLCSNSNGDSGQYSSMSYVASDFQDYRPCHNTGACATSLDSTGIDGASQQLNLTEHAHVKTNGEPQHEIYNESASKPSESALSTILETNIPADVQEIVPRTMCCLTDNANTNSTCHVAGTISKSTTETLPLCQQLKYPFSARIPDQICLGAVSTQTPSNTREPNVLTRMLDCDVYTNTITAEQTPAVSHHIDSIVTTTVLPSDSKEDNNCCETKIPVNNQYVGACDRTVLSTSSQGSMSEPVPTIPHSNQCKSEATLPLTPCKASTHTKSNIKEIIQLLPPKEAIAIYIAFLKDESKTNLETFSRFHYSRN